MIEVPIWFLVIWTVLLILESIFMVLVIVVTLRRVKYEETER